MNKINIKNYFYAILFLVYILSIGIVFNHVSVFLSAIMVLVLVGVIIYLLNNKQSK